MTPQTRVAAATEVLSAARRAMAKRLTATILVSVGAAALLAALKAPDSFATTILLAAVATAGAVACLRNPVWTLMFLLATMVLRLALPSVLGMNPFLIAFAAFVISAGIWLAGNPAIRPKIGAIEVAMLLYVGWNVWSIVQVHDLPALIDPTLAERMPLMRALLISAVIPFVVYYVSRAIFTNWAALRILLNTVLIIGAWSAAVSIMQFTGPRWLVWPRYIVDAPIYINRANGLQNQPGVNGVLLTTGFAVAILLLSTIQHSFWRRILLWAVAAGCAYAVYLTHTRAAYLAFVVVIIIGAVWGKAYRRPFVTTIVILGVGLALNWSAFTSSDRSAGGVGSTNEVYDRLNANMTAIWAFSERPWSGWGLGRFLAINTYHHQRWSEGTPWARGLGVASHFNELGILAELGIIGLALWLAVLLLVFRRLVQAIRTLPPLSVSGRPLALTAFMSLTALVVLGLFADLRLLDYPNTMAFALAGAAVGAFDRDRGAQIAPSYVRIPRLRF